MRAYILKRLLLIPFTLWGIITVNFAIIQLAPGGPVDYILAQYRGMNTDTKSSLSSGVEIAQSNVIYRRAGSTGRFGKNVGKAVWF